jgi:hypothetical protein
MGAGQPTSPEKTIASAAAALGLADANDLSKLPRDGFARFTQKQLFECTKQFGLKGTSKLSKDQLADRILEEIKALQSPKATAKPKATKSKGETAEDITQLSHKFELGARGKVEEPSSIPWSYGYDRVTGMAVDPERLFAYWEVSDDSIARARAGLGSGGQDAWLNLRVYDTTGRIFDGTNAHSYFDHGLDRSDRQWFFHVGKPASSAFVDIGMKSREGYFVKIARSGRIDFPRREPVAWSEPEWLSVRSVWGPVEHAGRGAPARPHISAASGPGGPGPGPGGGEGPHPAPRRHVALLPWEEIIHTAEGGRVEVTEWEEYISEGGTELHRHMTWESPVMISAWEAGPFTHPVEMPEPIREQFVGPTRVYRVGGRTHLVHGPWQVVIRGIGAHYGRAVIARWELFRSWITEGSLGAEGTRRETRIPGSSEMMAGASEKRWRQGSEARLGGASEIYFLGASEVRARGASERLFMGASQYMFRGASERVVGGGSEVRMRGASERMLGGASERLGASERRLGGASERLGGSENRLGGGSEARLGGGSEPRLGGGSEIRLAGPMPPDSGYPSPDSISGPSQEGKE